ncbi:hypothetical protein L227DRAFT_303993 [Lentinus tigrinus ALCF2SS1-6]|uniref:Uncharacterized protein n=1 Tax=Lentinus tigrinus ALCF2SS1-6 TaxID=1328759 RepID=A0A5C2RWV2_9APHY|nr:hypothetical protein L227DRAFT_303993 [Lentinus tigrinus ALCF2SS1-6]
MTVVENTDQGRSLVRHRCQDSQPRPRAAGHRQRVRIALHTPARTPVCDVHNSPQLLASSDHHPANPFKSWRNHRTLLFLLWGSSLACTRTSISPTARPSSSRACPCTFAPSKHPFALFKSRVGATVAPASTLTGAISLSRASCAQQLPIAPHRPSTSVRSTLGPEAIADFSMEVFTHCAVS